MKRTVNTISLSSCYTVILTDAVTVSVIVTVIGVSLLSAATSVPMFPCFHSFRPKRKLKLLDNKCIVRHNRIKSQLLVLAFLWVERPLVLSSIC